MTFHTNSNSAFMSGSTLWGRGDPTTIPDYYSKTGAVKLPRVDERELISPSERKMLLKFWDTADEDRKELKSRYDAEMKRRSRNNRPAFEIWTPRGVALNEKELRIQKGPPRFMNIYDTCTLNGLTFRCVHADDVEPDGSQNAGVAVGWEAKDGSSGIDFGVIQRIVRTCAYSGAEETVLLKVKFFKVILPGTYVSH